MKKLTTNILTWENIQNQSSYSASAVSLSGSYGSNSPSKNPDNATFRESALGQAFANSASSSSPGFTPGLPAHESGGDGSTTYATISAGRLNIGGKDTSVEELGIHSNPESAHRQIEALPDLQQLMQNQQTVAQSTATIASAVRTFSGNMAQKAALEQAGIRAQAEQELQAYDADAWAIYQAMNEADKQIVLFESSPKYAQSTQAAQDWGIGGSNSRALNAVTTALTGVLGGQTNLQAATNALAPYVTSGIGQQFGHGENQNEAAQYALHGILGATLAYLNGANPLSGGSAAIASEAAVQSLSAQYNDGKTAIDPSTGEFNPNLLPESAKEEIRSLSSAIGAMIGGAAGNSAFNTQLAGVIGQNAVENNGLGFTDISQMIAELNKAETKQQKQAILNKYRQKSEQNLKADMAKCQSQGDACRLKALDGLRDVNLAAAATTNNGLWLLFTPKGRNELEAYGLAQEVNNRDIAAHESQLTSTGKAIDFAANKGLPLAAAVYGGMKGVQGQTKGKEGLGISASNASQPKAMSPVDGETFTTRNIDFNARNISTKIHQGAQGKHIIGHNNHTDGKSALSKNINPQELLDGIHTGKYPVISRGARGDVVVDFGKPIGIDNASGAITNFGTIHSGKNGAHIVPANPKLIKKVK